MRLRRQVIVTLVLGIVTTISVAWVATARTWLSTGIVANAATPAKPLTAAFTPAITTPPPKATGGVRTWISGSQRIGAVQQCVSWTSESQERGQIQAWIANSSGLIRINTSNPTANAPPPFWSMPRRDFDVADPLDGHAFYEEVAAGWPLPALRWTRRVAVDGGKTSVTDIGAWRTPSWAQGFVKAHDLPYAPIPLGFAVDAFAFALGWFVLIFGYPTYRRLRRHAAGHCPRCGYNLRGDLAAGCPECGWNRAPSQSPSA